jgi:hypothetical protein
MMMQEEAVAVDPDGVSMFDETDRRVFVPYPDLRPRATMP